MLEVKLNNAGYDPFIDFMKGMCIVWVVLTHSIPYEWQQLIGFPFWGAQAVPLFLLIQGYHYFKKDTPPSFNWAKLFKRIVVPFAIAQAIILASIFIDYYCFHSGRLTTPIVDWMRSGGDGPGSYYFWIYLQFALLLPCVGWVQRRINMPSWGWAIVFVVISELLEIICSVTNIPDRFYRLCAFRYVFLIYGGYLWAKDGIKMNWKTALLSVISIIAIYLLQYKQLTFEPWIFSTAWTYFHWFCYFWVMFGLANLTNVLFKTGGGRFAQIIQYIGKYSYEIFIFQMLVFYFFLENISKWMYFVITTLLSIVPVVVYKYVRTKFETKSVKA